MGLDLIVEGCARPGHEAEWRRTLEHAFANKPLTEAETARFQEISIPPYERVGAPRVGYDAAADAWILEERKAVTPEEIAAVLKEFHGHYALPLATSDGLPPYTHANLYDGVDETSFRGAFLALCGDVLSPDLREAAWTDKFPEAAVDYGRALLAAAATAAAAGPPATGPPATDPPPRCGLLSRLLGKRPPPDPQEPFEEQLKIVEAAGRWHVFWGERGHPIHAWV